MNKMVMVSYNEAVDTEVMEVLSACGLENYTKATGTFGKGTTSGTHLGNDIWPGRNSLLYIACEEKESRQLISCIKELRKKLGKEGVKAFVLPIEEVT
ncbi:MAG: PG0541 family transporter-associated protein [Candidatus Omnitrophota bacterium]